jgi:hypothetical protein
MLDSYGRFIDDSRDYIISQALELVFKRDEEFARRVDQQTNANNNAERMVSRTDSAGLAPQPGPQRDERGKRHRAETAGEVQRQPKYCELCRQYGIGSLSLSRLAVSE